MALKHIFGETPVVKILDLELQRKEPVSPLN